MFSRFVQVLRYGFVALKRKLFWLVQMTVISACIVGSSNKVAMYPLPV